MYHNRCLLPHFFSTSDKPFWGIIFLFLLTGLCIIWLKAVPKEQGKIDGYHVPLQLEGWQGEELTMDPYALKLIQPDMFLFRNYIKEEKVINVYVGYYCNLDKSDLAHSPLVCYPGSGWVIRDKKNIVLSINGQNICFNQLLIEKGCLRKLVIYGYKAGDLTTSSLIRLRFHLVANKLSGKSTASAFIRFSTEFINNEEEKTQNLLKTFLQDFDMHLNKLFDASS